MLFIIFCADIGNIQKITNFLFFKTEGKAWAYQIIVVSLNVTNDTLINDIGLLIQKVLEFSSGSSQIPIFFGLFILYFHSFFKLFEKNYNYSLIFVLIRLTNT